MSREPTERSPQSNMALLTECGAYRSVVYKHDTPDGVEPLFV